MISYRPRINRSQSHHSKYQSLKRGKDRNKISKRIALKEGSKLAPTSTPIFFASAEAKKKLTSDQGDARKD